MACQLIFLTGLQLQVGQNGRSASGLAVDARGQRIKVAMQAAQ
jgi:hypothetical protein